MLDHESREWLIHYDFQASGVYDSIKGHALEWGVTAQSAKESFCQRYSYRKPAVLSVTAYDAEKRSTKERS